MATRLVRLEQFCALGAWAGGGVGRSTQGLLPVSMLLLVILMLVGSVIADELLVRAIKHEDPERYRKLGQPVLTAVYWNPFVAFRVAALVLLPSPYEAGSDLHRRIWISRAWILGFVGSIVLAVIIGG